MQRPHPRTARPRCSGFSVLELTIGLAILTLIMVNVSTIVRSTTDVYHSGALLSRLEDQAQQTMDRIVYAIMSTRGDDLSIPLPPLSRSSIEYEVLLGVEDGIDIWGDPSRIELVVEDGQVVWSQNPGILGERRVVWTHWVPEYLEDEFPNGEDDNGNALCDEAGLAFDMEEGQITIRLTLRRTEVDQVVYTRTLTSRVTCRN